MAEIASRMAGPWVVFARSTCRHTDRVVNYLARHTHRIAISNGRLQRLEGDQVAFTYKDYAAGGTTKLMHLHGEEFVRRLLLHVLPHGFMRIRHFGFLANCHRRQRLAAIRRCLAGSIGDPEPPTRKRGFNTRYQYLLQGNYSVRFAGRGM